jgi:trehalose-phosphatase
VYYWFEHLESFHSRIRSAEKIFLFLDYDGTLTDIVARPEDAYLSPEMKATLLALSTIPRLTLAVVSGRSLEDVRNRVGLKGIHYSGSHGLEVSYPSHGTRQLISENRVETLRMICDRLKRQLGAIEGIFVEEKKCTVAVHYRNADPGCIAHILATVRQEIRDADGPFELTEGKKVFEIKPKSTLNKGTAVLDILSSDDRAGAVSIYVGDDRTDEDAFKALAGRGITVFVGTPGLFVSSAQYYANDPSEVRQLLETIQEELSGASSPFFISNREGLS